MLTKRIIPCLDLKNGRVVKGEQFVDLRDAGDPVRLAEKYYQAGADELCLLDIIASLEKRKIILSVVEKVAANIFIPFTVGGGIGTIADIRSALRAGADKVSVNTAAVKNPKIISEAANIFGSQCVVAAIDAKKEKNRWKVYINGGRIPADLDAVTWAKKVVNNGAGEILLTSMNYDGTKLGYDISLTIAVSEAVSVPVIASGGAGKLEDFYEIIAKGKADAVLAASLFHYGELEIKDVKKYLKRKGVAVRIA